jgi:hypothetical protein
MPDGRVMRGADRRVSQKASSPYPAAASRLPSAENAAIRGSALSVFDLMVFHRERTLKATQPAVEYNRLRAV